MLPEINSILLGVKISSEQRTLHYMRVSVFGFGLLSGIYMYELSTSGYAL